MIPKSSACILFINVLMCMTTCDSAKILCVAPTASYSHQQPILALTRALAARGHDLTVITANPSKVPIKNHRDIDLSHMYDIVRSDKMEDGTGFSLQKRSDGFKLVKLLPNMMEFFMSEYFKSSQIQDLIKELNGTKYDLIMYEALLADSFLGFSDLIGNPPIIGFATFPLLGFINDLLGNPFIPSYIPSIYFSTDDHMTFWERLQTLYFELYSKYIWNWYIQPIYQRFMHENFGNYHRSLYELEHNQSLLIISADLTNGYPKPLHPNTIYVGPMHLRKKVDSLPQDIQKWMDESEEGVIYFSLGSNMQGTSVPEETRAAFIKAFKQFPKVRVLWKWESDTKLPGQPDNVLVKKWLPQQPILAHPKLRLFISQVGLQSFQEATYYAVPMLGVPMFGDQDYNAKKLVSTGAGLSIEFQSITYDKLHELLKELLTNNSYEENMLRQSSITKDTQMSPVDTAIWWVEYVLRHNGAPHLRPAALDLTWYQYYMLDILLLVVVLISIFVFVLYLVVNKVVKLVLLSTSTLPTKAKHNNNNKKIN